MEWTRKKLIKAYIDFYKSKNHNEIANSRLVPEDDPTVLFTTAGMHPLVPFLLGQKHPQGKRLVNVQKCIRTQDIDEVGDSSHLTFFEMLGNWSLGDYFKEGAIEYSYEFLTKILGIPKEKIAVSCFGGDDRVPQVPKDIESAKIWEKVGIPKERIGFLKGGVFESKNNWWGPAGKTGPCGPDTEFFYWIGEKSPRGNPENNEKEWLEIGNDVLMQYVKDEQGNYNEAKQKNVDFGGGVERTVAVLNGLEDNYLTEVWKPIINEIEKLSKKDYTKHKEKMRIIADHIKASVFIIADGIQPSNTGQGYVLRRLIRRCVRLGKFLALKNFAYKVAEPVFEIYNDYKELKKNKNKILETLKLEEEKFNETIEKGIKIFEKLTKNKKELSGKEAFLLYQSYGFPIELIEEEVKNRKIKIDKKDFFEELKKHQELSRTATKGKFVAGLSDNSKQSTKYHTATHMLHKALKLILGSEVQQMGSNITPERLRFDFNFPRKLTDEEIKKIGDLVNREIKKNHKVTYKEMPYKEAIKTGALSYFREKYPEIVKVYSVGDFSKEICTGPHVKNTSELGKFKITKEESSSAGVRRIKAVLG